MFSSIISFWKKLRGEVCAKIERGGILKIVVNSPFVDFLFPFFNNNARVSILLSRLLSFFFNRVGSLEGNVGSGSIHSSPHQFNFIAAKCVDGNVVGK